MHGQENIKNWFVLLGAVTGIFILWWQWYLFKPMHTNCLLRYDLVHKLCIRDVKSAVVMQLVCKFRQSVFPSFYPPMFKIWGRGGLV